MKTMIFAFVLMLSTFVFAEEVPASAEEVPVPGFINLDNADLNSAPEVYEVVPGDTLWDISEKELKSPWYWPKVWSLNPQIQNPHLIYPGDKISFRETGEMSMPGNENSGRNGANGENGEDGEGYNAEYEDEGETDPMAQTGKTLDATPENYKDFVKLGGKYRIDRFKQIDDTVMDVVQKGFIGTTEEDELAKIVASFEPKELLATGDNVYVEISGDKEENEEKDKDKDEKDDKSNKNDTHERKKSSNFQIGDYVEILHIGKKIKHPESGDKLGSIVEIVGRGKVLDIGKKKNDDDDDETQIATVKIIKAYDAIERGFHVREYVEQENNVPVKETDADIKATVLTGYDPTVFYGPNYIVYIDKGTNDGVEPGIMLSVYRKGDGLKEFEGKKSPENLPWEMIGELVVISAGEQTSVAVITNSLTALEAGDMAVTGEIEE